MPPPMAPPVPAGGPGPASAAAPPPGDAGDAVPSSPAGGTPLPDQATGMLPPTTAPTPQNVTAAGNEALGMQMMRSITGALHFVRGLFSPTSKYLKSIDSAFRSLSREFAPDSDSMKGGKLPTPGTLAQPSGPPLGGMGGAAGGPPSPPRGPIAMAPGAGRRPPMFSGAPGGG